jgi:hypothetical protein
VEWISNAAARLSKITAERTMRTNGLVWAVALSLSLTGRVGAAEPADNSNNTDAAKPASSEFDDQANYDGNVTYYAVPQDPGFVYAGAEMTMLHVDARPVATVDATMDVVATPGTEFLLATNAEFTNWGYSPRAWVGAHLNENWSVEGRYWHLNDSATVLNLPTNVGVPTGEIFPESTTIEAYTIDLDLIRTCYLGGWQIDSRLGARHGSFTAENFVSGHNSVGVNDNDIVSHLAAGFNGTGFSYGGAMKHSIGNSNLFWVTSARGSYLNGTERLTRNFSAQQPSGGFATNATTDHDAELVIAEFQTGVEWDYALTAIPANAFVRLSYEFQDWHVSGPITFSSTSGGGGGVNDSAGFHLGLGELTLQGIALAGGINW